MKKTPKTPKKTVNSKDKDKQNRSAIQRNHYVANKISAKNAFDLDNLDGLPEITRHKLGSCSVRGAVQHVFSELFEMKSTLSIDELQVGVYRVFGLEKPREWIKSNVSALKSKGMIKNVPGEAGIYELVK